MQEQQKDVIPFSVKFRAVSRHLKRYKRELIVISILGIFSALANGTVPLFVGRFLDALLKPTSVSLPLLGIITTPVLFLSIWVLAQLLGNTMDWIIGRRSSLMGNALQAQYVVDAYSHLYTLPVSFFKSKKAGDLTEIVNRTSWMLETIVNSILINLAPQLLSIIVGICIAFYLQPILAGILLTGVLLYVLVLLRFVGPVGKLQARARRLWSEAFGKAYDAYTNLQTLKQAGAEEYEHDRVHDAFFGEEGANNVYDTVGISWNNINAYQRVLVVATQLTIFSFSIAFVLKGTLTIGDLIAFNAYASLIFGPFVTLGSQWQVLQNALTGAAQAEEIFATPSELYNPPGADNLSDFQGKVRFHDVHFTYEPNQPEVLKGVSFDVSPGEVVALVGQTGAGKSTIAELISGYYFPTSGEVLIDDHTIESVSLRELRSRIAIVPQEVVLFNTSIMDNIRYGRPEAGDSEVKEAARKAYADTFIEKFPEGYAQLVGERGVKLSVGQKQRIAIARAILRNPRILILDEPTSALDAETEQHITVSLEELMQGRTTFIIAHRLSTVRAADKILVIKNGKIVEQGNHQTLMEIPKGVYRHLYELHIGLHE